MYYIRYMNFTHKQTSRIKNADLNKTASKLESYRSKLLKVSKDMSYNHDESSINLSFDKTLLAEVKKSAKKFSSSKLKFIVVIGIGGSNLGTRAVFDALRHTRKGPVILFLDTVSETKINKISNTLKSLKSKQEFLLVTISKSGGTTEVIANTEALINTLAPKFKKIEDRLVVITGENSKLWNLAKVKKIETLSIPDKVGGRYSVLSSVGLFPLAVAGFNINKLLTGAQNAVSDNLSKKSNSITSATIKNLHYKKGFQINNNFFFAPELEALGKWERQLVAESLGKDGIGITPIVSIGSTDMHSMAQLYFGGPNNKFTTVITTKNQNKISVPKNLFFGNLVDDVNNKSIDSIISAISTGTKKAFAMHEIPFVSIEFNKMNEEELGYYFQFRMIETMYLAKLLKVNAFDQPAVETYKNETRKLLKK
jgi:glucose-6-phosphate isomerase